MKANSKTLGFLPRDALLEYLRRDGVLGARDEESRIIGYIMYAKYRDYIRVAQLCVKEGYTGQGIARKLFEELKASVTTQQVIQLRCRRDFSVNRMWPKLGFVPLDEKVGRSHASHSLVLWQYSLTQSPQTSILDASTLDQPTVQAIIDANIFFDIDEHEPVSENTIPSRSLYSDLFADHLTLSITDELFVEINRNDDKNCRDRARERAKVHLRIEYNPKVADRFEDNLSKILSIRNERDSDRSDIRQLAKAAASSATVFVTRDARILSRSRELEELTQLEILSPTALIIKIDQLMNSDTYSDKLVSGVRFHWRRLTQVECEFIGENIQDFLLPYENKSGFVQQLNSYIARTEQYQCKALMFDDRVIAIRVEQTSQNDMCLVIMARMAHSIKDRNAFRIFFLVSPIYDAIDRGISTVKYQISGIESDFFVDLQKVGFTKECTVFVRFCLSGYLRREEILSTVKRLSPSSVPNYREMPLIVLQKSCSPVAVRDLDIPRLLIPIRPQFAKHLFNFHQASSDLFGGNLDVLLRWSNVYYRSKSHSIMITAPAHILWYVSQQSEIVGTSILDYVTIGKPKALFRRFEKHGTLAWKDIYEMCKRDVLVDLMALQFSHTLLFKSAINLTRIKEIYASHGARPPVMRSPLKIISNVYQDLIAEGFSVSHK